MKKEIIYVAIAVAIIGFLVNCYVGVKDNRCPICGSSVHYEGTIVKGDKNSMNTYYRYVCDKHGWHMIDLLFKVDGH